MKALKVYRESSGPLKENVYSCLKMKSLTFMGGICTYPDADGHGFLKMKLG